MPLVGAAPGPERQALAPDFQRGDRPARAAGEPGKSPRDDDRAAMERDLVREMAKRHDVNVTVAYLIVDEGIRLKWTVPGGTPLSATVSPLQMK